VKAWVFPIAIVVLAGVTAIDTRVGVTVRVVVPVTDPLEAEMVVLPAATAVAKPAVLTVATAGLEDSQFALDVRFLVLPSL
jgi:hypothetical protein